MTRYQRMSGALIEQIAGPSPPTRRPARDALPPETGQTNHRPGCHAPDPWPSGGRAGHA